MDELTTRNFHTMSEGLKSVRNETDKLKEDLKRKDAIISQLSTQQQTMQQQLSVLFAKTMGSGSTT
ncbi:MAG: hypothetical protein J7L15_03540 [Clostridiales bacterium]|nr:hypothetical protein [Clostridiales bacterium]